KPLRRPRTWRKGPSPANFAPLLPTMTASLAMNRIRSSALPAAHAAKNDFVTTRGSLPGASCACDGAKLHNPKIAVIQMMPCLILRLPWPLLPEAYMEQSPAFRSRADSFHVGTLDANPEKDHQRLAARLFHGLCRSVL